MHTLLALRCAPQSGKPLDAKAAAGYAVQVPAWIIDSASIWREFKFHNYYETIAFVNLVAFISHREDHHPDLEVGYNRCVVRYSTHSVGGLSVNDFICAAKIEAAILQ
jgi:4a-hydroxytetrahydrobiopterin dehydratase